MQYVNRLTGEDVKNFLNLVGINEIANRMYVQEGEDCLVAICYQKSGLFKTNKLKVYLYDYDISIEGTAEKLISQEKLDDIRLEYKLFMTYMFGNAKYGYKPYKDDCLKFYVDLYDALWNSNYEETEGLDENAKQKISDNITQEMFLYKNRVNTQYFEEDYRTKGIKMPLFDDEYGKE